jgi:LPS-assembly protein
VDNSRTLQTLPEIGLAAVRQQLFSTPLFFDLDLTASNFYREKGSTGQRLSALPRLTLISGIPGYLNASAFAGVRLRAYNTDKIPAVETIDRNNGKALPEAGTRISSVFSRIYEVNGENLKKMRHELTPEISYYYSPDQVQSSLPLYDFTDRLIHQNTIYFGLTSHLGGKFQQGDTAEYRDISKISLLQGYSLEGTRRDLLTAVDDNRPWSDLILTSETWLHQRAKFNLDSRYNLYDNRFNSVAPGLEFDNGMGSSAAVYYRFSRNFVEYLEARLSTKAIKSWTFGYTARYSFDRNDFLETVYSTEYRHQCWSVSLAFRDRPGNQSYLVNFNLAGLTGI